MTTAATPFLKENGVMKKWWLFTLQQLLGKELYEDFGDIDKQMNNLIDIVEAL